MDQSDALVMRRSSVRVRDLAIHLVKQSDVTSLKVGKELPRKWGRNVRYLSRVSTVLRNYGGIVDARARVIRCTEVGHLKIVGHTGTIPVSSYV